MAEKKISINQLAGWLSTATSNNKKYLLKPSDLKMLYLIFLYEYITNNSEKPIENDGEIQLPESRVVKMVQLFYDNNYYQYYNRVFHL